MIKKIKIGWSPLTIATSCGCDDIVDILVSNGANVNTKTKNGCTPLHYSSSKNRVSVNNNIILLFKITKYLIKHGAKVDVRENISGETPLHRATSWFIIYFYNI